MGLSRFLKAMKPDIKVVCAQPTRGHYIQGLKNMEEAIVPDIYDPSKIDIQEMVESEEAIAMARPVRQGNSRGFPPPVSIQGRVRAPYGMPSVFARPCGTSQVREWRAGPASCVKAGTKTAGKTSVSPARVSG